MWSIHVTDSGRKEIELSVSQVHKCDNLEYNRFCEARVISTKGFQAKHCNSVCSVYFNSDITRHRHVGNVTVFFRTASAKGKNLDSGVTGHIPERNSTSAVL